MSTKAKEECVVEVQQEYITLHEKSDSFKAMLNPFKPVYFDLKLESFSEMVDLFQDGTAFKRILKGSYTTTAPDASSRMYFDYVVHDNKDNVVFSSSEWSNSSLQRVFTAAAHARRHPYDGRERDPKDIP